MFLDLQLEELIQLAAAILDVPVYLKAKTDGKQGEQAGIAHIEAVHALFTLFLEFRNSQHFSLLAKSLV